MRAAGIPSKHWPIFISNLQSISLLCVTEDKKIKQISTWQVSFNLDGRKVNKQKMKTNRSHQKKYDTIPNGLFFSIFRSIFALSPFLVRSVSYFSFLEESTHKYKTHNTYSCVLRFGWACTCDSVLVKWMRKNHKTIGNFMANFMLFYVVWTIHNRKDIKTNRKFENSTSLKFGAWICCVCVLSEDMILNMCFMVFSAVRRIVFDVPSCRRNSFVHQFIVRIWFRTSTSNCILLCILDEQSPNLTWTL